MLNTDLFWATDWNGAYNYLTYGDFPLVLQLLAINTIAMTILLVRAIMSKHKMRATSAYVVQGLLVAANIAVFIKSDNSYWITKFLS